MTDVLWKTGDYVFSYRVAGICRENGSVLLQKPTNGNDFAFPGGHVSLGETNGQTLEREFREEIGAQIRVGALRWVGELFFPWGEHQCHQICLYYDIEILSPEIPRTGVFPAREQIDGRSFQMEFHWVPLDELRTIEVYPTNVYEMLVAHGVQHFIYQEK